MKQSFAALAILAWASAAQALTTFDESVDGDADGSRQDATLLGPVSAGSNFNLIGTVNGTGDSRDWYRFSTGGGFQIDLDSLSVANGNRRVTFQLRDATNNAVIDTVRTGSSVTNLFGPLDAGDYYLSVRENRAGTNAYGLSIIAPVPLPAPILLLLSAICGLGLFRWFTGRRRAT
ncbi:MAG: hypothetical protein AAF218_07580 [Pseudomonadota bacterium]